MTVSLGAIASRVPTSQTGAGRLLRLPLRAIPEDTVVRVLGGPNRGLRWVAGSTVHGCWLGTYEFEKARLFREQVRPGSVVFDIGAHVGYYTLIAARAAGSTGRVHAFEPLPENFALLQQHILINGLSNVYAEALAISEHTGRARFLAGAHRSMGRLVSDGGTGVDATRLDDLGGPLPTLLKIDVEGAELAVLRGATGMLTSARPNIFLATHGADLHEQCLDLLGSFDYAWRTIGNSPDELIAYPAEAK